MDIDYNIQVSFKANDNWFSFTGESVFWGDFETLNKTSLRPYPNYLAPEIVTIDWQGKNYDAMHSRWNSYVLQLFLQEKELNKFSQIKSADTVEVKQLTTGETHALDLTVSDYLELNVEKIDGANVWKAELIYRTEKIVINKNSAKDTDIVKISITNLDLDTSSATFEQFKTPDTEFDSIKNADNEIVFYSKFKQVQKNLNNEQEYVSNLNGSKTLTFAQNNKGFDLLFLLNDIDTYYFNKYMNLCNTIKIYNYNNATTEYDLVAQMESLNEIESERLGEGAQANGWNKTELSIITETTQSYGI